MIEYKLGTRYPIVFEKNSLYLDQYVHPTVFNFQGKLYLTCTPYPEANNKYENPCIYELDVAGKAIEFRRNPIVDTPNDGYHSDFHVAVIKKILIGIFRWRTSTLNKIMLITSLDVIHWSSPITLREVSTSEGDYISPSIFEVNSKINFTYHKKNNEEMECYAEIYDSLEKFINNEYERVKLISEKMNFKIWHSYFTSNNKKIYGLLQDCIQPEMSGNLHIVVFDLDYNIIDEKKITNTGSYYRSSFFSIEKKLYYLISDYFNRKLYLTIGLKSESYFFENALKVKLIGTVLNTLNNYKFGNEGFNAISIKILNNDEIDFEFAVNGEGSNNQFFLGIYSDSDEPFINGWRIGIYNGGALNLQQVKNKIIINEEKLFDVTSITYYIIKYKNSRIEINVNGIEIEIPDIEIKVGSIGLIGKSSNFTITKMNKP
jgi:hypothetical protein